MIEGKECANSDTHNACKIDYEKKSFSVLCIVLSQKVF